MTIRSQADDLIIEMHKGEKHYSSSTISRNKYRRCDTKNSIHKRPVILRKYMEQVISHV